MSPQQAWIKLHAGRKERLTGQEGLHAFGLRSKSVCQLIQHLPLAVRCERYSCWPEGDAPVVPGLVSKSPNVHVCKTKKSRDFCIADRDS